MHEVLLSICIEFEDKTLRFKYLNELLVRAPQNDCLCTNDRSWEISRHAHNRDNDDQMPPPHTNVPPSPLVPMALKALGQHYEG